MSKYKVRGYRRDTAEPLWIYYVEAKSDADAERILLDRFDRHPTDLTGVTVICSIDSCFCDNFDIYINEAVAVYRNFQSFKWTGTMGLDGEFEQHLILRRSHPVYAFPVKLADGTTAHEYIRVPDALCTYKSELVTCTSSDAPVYDALPNHHKIYNIGRRWVAEGAVNVPENTNVRRFVKQYVTDLVRDYMTAQDMMIRDAIGKL